MCDESDDFEHRKGLTCWYFQNGFFEGDFKGEKKAQNCMQNFLSSALLSSLLRLHYINKMEKLLPCGVII
jgi:hypothetical protein